MNMQMVPDMSAQTLHQQLQQLQGLEMRELRTQTHALSRQFCSCTIYGPVLLDNMFVTEISDGEQTVVSKHRLPTNYCVGW